MTPGREHALLDALARAPRPLSGEELGSLLQVSSRTVRNHVRQLNQHEVLVSTSHHGYALTDLGRRRASRTDPSDPSRFDTPQRRLGHLCRVLPQSTDPLSVHDLADRLCVSESTLEADLARVREVLREHGVVLRRDHDQVWAEGSERNRRRVVRQVLQQAGHDIAPNWDVIAREFPDVDLPGLRSSVVQAVSCSDVEMNEYALSDIVIHLVVTLDRIQSGHTITPTEAPPTRRDQGIESLCRHLATMLGDWYGLSLPDPEFQSLYAAIAVRAVGRPPVGAGLVPTSTLNLVEEAMAHVADRFLLGRPDTHTLLKLAVHVDNVVARARSGVALSHPLGAAFRNTHPLVHEMAITFAGELEPRLGIAISASEVDYISLHMGMLYMTFLEQRDLPTVTLVVPRYHGLEQTVAQRLVTALQGKAVLERTLSTVQDADEVTTDMVVACGPVPATAAPVVVVSPPCCPRTTSTGWCPWPARNARASPAVG